MSARRCWSVAALAAIAVSLGARPVHAQGLVGLTPWAGIYVPTRNSFSSVGTSIKRNNSFIGGARLTFWGKSPLGLELAAGFAPARVKVAGATINQSRNTNVFLGSFKLMFGISHAVSPLGIYVGAGPAIVRRGRDLLQSGQSRTEFGGAAGVGLRLPIGSVVSVRFDAEDYAYGGNFDGSKKFQNDLALGAGLSIWF